MSKVQLALPLVVGIVIRCLLPKKDFFCEETPSMDPVAPAAPTPVRPALSMDSLVAHVQHLKEPLEQIRREVEDSSLLAVRNYALKKLPAEGQTLPVKPVTLQQFQPVQTVSPCGKLCESCEEFCVPWNSHFFGMLGDCGHVCKIEPDGHHVNKSKGKFFDEFRKTVDCGKIWSSPHMDVPGEHGHPPRLSNLPKELVDLYTYGGKVKMTEWYLDQKYYGTNSMNSPSAMVHHWKRKTIQDWIQKARAKTLGGNYGIGETNCLAAGLDDADLKGKSVLVIGSENPWVEALCLSKGAAKVTTLEYANLTSSHPLVDTVTPATLASLVSQNKAPSFDAVVTFSSVEHSGLGRYGDALNPFGDLITMARAWCLAKPNADLVIGVMVGGSGQSTIRFNAHREYGAVSYAQLFANWQQMTSHQCDQSVYTLKKLDVI